MHRASDSDQKFTSSYIASARRAGYRAKIYNSGTAGKSQGTLCVTRDTKQKKTSSHKQQNRARGQRSRGTKK